jgi:hypothetical protein
MNVQLIATQDFIEEAYQSYDCADIAVAHGIVGAWSELEEGELIDEMEVARLIDNLKEALEWAEGITDRLAMLK